MLIYVIYLLKVFGPVDFDFRHEGIGGVLFVVFARGFVIFIMWGSLQVVVARYGVSKEPMSRHLGLRIEHIFLSSQNLILFPKLFSNIARAPNPVF